MVSGRNSIGIECHMRPPPAAASGAVPWNRGAGGGVGMRVGRCQGRSLNGRESVVKRYLSAISAAAVAVALSAPAFAQGLDDATAAGLAQLGIQAPAVETMTVEQVAQIKNVLSSTDANDVKRMRIEEIIGGEASATGRLGVGQLQDSVGRDLAAIGVDASNVDMLTLSQLAQIENVMASSDTDDVKKLRVEEIIGGEATATGRLGVRQLQDSVAAGLASLGIDAEVVETLTLSQLGQIENVMASSSSPDEKKAQVDRIIAE
jgi:hypothetical protein